jgi:uncharacterized protein (TIGR02118 family)
MITRIGMAPRLPGATVEEFQEHWRTSHADAAGRIPGVRRYVQNHALTTARGRLVFPYPGFDACSELDFDSVEAMDAGFASETFQRDVQADERAFVDKTRFSLLVCNRSVLLEGPEDSGVKLITFYRAHPAAGAGELPEALRGPHAAAVRAGRAVRHELHLPRADAHAPGRLPAAADAADMIWFESLVGLMEFVDGSASLHLAGKAFGTARVAARPVEVV